MELDKFNLILGSESPRRKELLSWLNIPFQVSKANLEEISHEISPEKIAMDLASQKGQEVFKKCSLIKNVFIISSDTLVVLEGKIYGKPKDENEARETLLQLSGKTHQVITGVSFIFKKAEDKMRKHNFYDFTDVTFNKIDDNLLKDYLKTKDSLDKAGAYGIQGPGLTFISKINGSYSNVVGFPLDKIINELSITLGKSWREQFLT